MVSYFSKRGLLADTAGKTWLNYALLSLANHLNSLSLMAVILLVNITLIAFYELHDKMGSCFFKLYCGNIETITT